MSKKIIQADAVGADESYAGLRGRLDDVLAKLQDPDCDVDEAAGLYEQALALGVRIEDHLTKAENHIRKVGAAFGIRDVDVLPDKE